MQASDRHQPVSLLSIQALRGIAASAVVLSHVARHLDKDHGAPVLVHLFEAGHAGVDLFFVLSGFIILFVHSRDIGQPQQLGRYARRRFDRVMPLYWLALALTVAMSLAGGRPLPSASWLLQSASLLPSTQKPVLDIAWTLQREVMFYAFFAVLIYSRRLGMIAMGAWLVGILAALALPAGQQLMIFGDFGLQFFFGMGAAWAVLGGWISAPRRLAAMGAVAFVGAYAAESAGVLPGFSTATRFAYGISAALLVAGLASAERVRPLAAPAWLNRLGDASYSIYLFQFICIGPTWQVWQRLGLSRYAPDWVCFVVLSAAALAGGIMVSVVVEKPLLHAMRRVRRPAVA